MATMSLQAAYDQARSYLEANKVEQAIGVAQHILEHFPESLEAHRILGEAYLAGRQFEQAEAAFARVLRADPEDIPAHVGLGITYERQGKLDNAVAEFEQALEVRPDMPELRSQLLRLYTDIWGSEGATLRLSRPGLARLYAKGHMLPQAIQEYRGVIEEMPERFDARVGLAEALWRNQQEQQAAEVCSEILALRPEVLKANLLLGYIKLASGDPEGEVFWRQAQQLDPYQQTARSLFETLPELPAPDVQIPAWDEAAWAERRAREEAERRAREEAERRAAQAAVAAAAVAAPEQEAERLVPAWGAAEASAAGHAAFDDDDLLASLLAMEPPVPTERGVDLDTSSGIVPFSLEDLDSAAPQGSAASEEPELEPFSLADLGLSEEEIAQLRAEPEPLSSPPAVALPATLAEEPVEDLETPTQPPVASETAGPELEPFSLEELGLSPEEIARLEAAASEAAATPAEPESAPFSSREAGFVSGEIGRSSGATEAQAPEELELADVTPFSLDEFDLNAPSFEAAADELPPSLRAFSIDEPSAATPPAPAEEVEPEGAYSWQQPSAKAQPGFASQQEEEAPGQGSIFDRLKARASALPPQEPEPLRPIADEELEQSDYFSHDDVSLREEDADAQNRFAGGFRLPREEAAIAGIAAAAAAAGRAGEQAPAEPAAEQAPAEPELTPFSLEELGLSPEEIAQLEAAQAAEAAATPAPEPELTPFSLEELGLSPEEIAQLEAAQAATEAPATDEGEDLFDFDLAGAPPVEKMTKRVAPRVEEPPPPVDAADAAFQPEPLDSLDDIWETPLSQAPAPAVREEPPAEAPPRRERPAEPPVGAVPPPRSGTAPAPRREGERLITRGRDEERFARREAARVREPGARRGSATLTMRLSDLVPTGDATLDEYLRQLEGDPENSGLALAIGRLCAQTGRADVMTMAYKGLIRTGQDLDLLTEELEGLIDVISDGDVQRQLFRLLGDAYAKQGRSRDAVAAYGQAFSR